MKKTNLNVLFIALGIMSLSLVSQAQLPALTNGYPAFPAGTFVNGESGYIDINGDNTNDFVIIYSNSSYMILSANSSNLLMVEDVLVPTGAPLQGSGAPLTTNPTIPMVKLYGPNETIGSAPNSTPPLTAGPGAYWNYYGYLTVQGITPPLTATSATSSSGYMGAYFPGGYYGWAYFTGIGGTSFTYSSSAASAGSITTPGATVPVPFIASLLAMMAIGGGVYFKRRRK